MAEPNQNKPPRNNGSGPGGPNKGGPNNFMSRGVVGWLLVVGLAILLLVMMNQAQNQANKVDKSQFFNYAQQSAFEGPVIIEDDRIIGELKEETEGLPADARTPYRVYLPTSRDTKEYYLRQLDEAGVTWQEAPGGSMIWQIVLFYGPIILIALFFYLFIFRSVRNAGGGAGMLGNFGRSKHKVTSKEHSNIRLTDVAGIDEAKDEVGEIIEFLKNPKKFQRLGGRVPRGVLLSGLPGCGKTLLAKAVAGEAEVPFFSISGSDFVEMFVGVGASRVRDLFKQAKDNSPCIIFLDEIDAVGRRRGSGFASGGHDEREQTLNAILVEMDGFETNDQVIVIAATNRPDVLDPALTRPGRFDRQIHVPLPDVRGRMEILKVHSRKIKLGPDVNLETLARGTPMFSGADLAAIINEAAIGATLENKDFVEQDDLEEARDKVRWGRARKSHRMEEDEKKVVAYHEAGHAVLMYCDPDSDPLHKVTIIPRGQSLGSTFMLPEKDKSLYSKKQLLSKLRVSYGGRIAEQMFTGDQYNGTGGDIRQATQIARAMVTEYGMSERAGFMLYAQEQGTNPWEQERGYSEETARMIDGEMRVLIDDTYQQALEIIEAHKEQLQAVAEALLEHETLTFDEVKRLMNGEKLGKPSVSELLKQEADKAEGKKNAPGDAEDSTDGEDDTPPEGVPSPV